MLSFKQHIAEASLPKANASNDKHNLGHAFVSGAFDLWIREEGTPKSLMKVFDELEQNIKRHYPSWTEDKAHHVGMSFMEAFSDIMDEQEDEVSNAAMKKIRTEVARKLHIHADLIKDFAKIEKHFF
jgi:hypothetical protein